LLLLLLVLLDDGVEVVEGDVVDEVLVVGVVVGMNEVDVLEGGIVKGGIVKGAVVVGAVVVGSVTVPPPTDDCVETYCR